MVGRALDWKKELAATGCAVMVACGLAWVRTNRNGLPARRTSSTVPPTAHRSARSDGHQHHVDIRQHRCRLLGDRWRGIDEAV
jgi:hypothetical protein